MASSYTLQEASFVSLDDLSSGETRKTFHKNVSLLSFRHRVSLKKHFIMYLLNNKNYLCRKIIRRKKQVAKHGLMVFKCIFRKSEDVAKNIILIKI